MATESESTVAPTVYVVDDDRAAAESICAVIETTGIQTQHFRSGEDFLNDNLSRGTGCAVVDYRLPGMTGLEVQRRLSQAHSLLPVILISGHADVPIAVKAMQQGAITLLQKPYKQEEFLPALEEALQISQQRMEHRREVQDARRRLARLDNKERDVLRFMLDGKPNKAVAYALAIGLRTVERRRHNIFIKTSVESEVKLAELVRLAEDPE